MGRGKETAAVIGSLRKRSSGRHAPTAESSGALYALAELDLERFAVETVRKFPQEVAVALKESAREDPEDLMEWWDEGCEDVALCEPRLCSWDADAVIVSFDQFRNLGPGGPDYEASIAFLVHRDELARLAEDLEDGQVGVLAKREPFVSFVMGKGIK